MRFPRFYAINLKYIILLLAICLLGAFTFINFATTKLDQIALEDEGLYRMHTSDFDPRQIIHVILSYINPRSSGEIRNSFFGDNGVYFHWDDWMDLNAGSSILDKYREKYPDGQCDNLLRSFAGVSAYSIETYETKVLRGMADLYCVKDIPKRILVSTDKRMVEVPVIGKKRMGRLRLPKTSKKLLIDLVKEVDQDFPSSRFKTFDFQRLKPTRNVTIDEFILEPDKEILHLNEKLKDGDINKTERERLDFLEYSTELAHKSNMYFKYPWITTDLIKGKSHHFAYPFFSRYMSNRERQSVIQHLVRAWFLFAESNNFASWVNYGSLLGWAFNGLNLPWDTDVDVQMPIKQLERLGKDFNRTLVIENPRYGNSKYFLDVSSTYVTQGNGKNFIDARFIDINSGLYIDITGLMHTTEKVPKKDYNNLRSLSKNDDPFCFHCKNWNWHSFDEIFPIRHTYFEGGSVYIPNNVSNILKRKYGEDSYTKKHHFLGYNYQEDISLWIPDKVCRKSPPGDRFQGSNKEGLTLYGACGDPYLQDEYKISRSCIERHLLLNKDIDTSASYDITTLKDLPILRKDWWEYYLDIIEKGVKDNSWYTKLEIVY